MVKGKIEAVGRLNAEVKKCYDEIAEINKKQKTVVIGLVVGGILLLLILLIVIISVISQATS